VPRANRTTPERSSVAARRYSPRHRRRLRDEAGRSSARLFAGSLGRRTRVPESAPTSPKKARSRYTAPDGEIGARADEVFGHGLAYHRPYMKELVVISPLSDWTSRVPGSGDLLVMEDQDRSASPARAGPISFSSAWRCPRSRVGPRRRASFGRGIRFSRSRKRYERAAFCSRSMRCRKPRRNAWRTPKCERGARRAMRRRADRRDVGALDGRRIRRLFPRCPAGGRQPSVSTQYDTIRLAPPVCSSLARRLARASRAG